MCINCPQKQSCLNCNCCQISLCLSCVINIFVDPLTPPVPVHFFCPQCEHLLPLAIRKRIFILALDYLSHPVYHFLKFLTLLLAFITVGYYMLSDCTCSKPHTRSQHNTALQRLPQNLTSEIDDNNSFNLLLRCPLRTYFHTQT